MTTAGHLVWYRGLRGFYAEKQPVGYRPPKDAPTQVAIYSLNAAQYEMSILILEQRFPCGAKLEDDDRVKLEW